MPFVPHKKEKKKRKRISLPKIIVYESQEKRGQNINRQPVGVTEFEHLVLKEFSQSNIQTFAQCPITLCQKRHNLDH